jgi:hypothetical protein
MQTGLYPVKYARAWVSSVHRRIPELTGAMWCLGLWDGADMRGLAVVGRPSARMLDVPARERIGTVEVLRVAVVEGTKNGCSMLYGGCARAGRAMGLDGMLTYIHDDETGVSLRASGWVQDTSTDGGEWSRPSRQRKLVLDSKPKTRWWAAWSDAARHRPTETEMRAVMACERDYECMQESMKP